MATMHITMVTRRRVAKSTSCIRWAPLRSWRAARAGSALGIRRFELDHAHRVAALQSALADDDHLFGALEAIGDLHQAVTAEADADAALLRLAVLDDEHGRLSLVVDD